MRVLAITFNVILLGFLTSLIVKNGFPDSDDSEFLFACTAILTPVFNLVYQFSDKKGDGWLSLYLRRKALEEQKKIDQMNS